LISSFQNEKDLNGIPKTAAGAELVSVLKKSEKTTPEKSPLTPLLTKGRIIYSQGVDLF
jgi:hypothetical protein